jgi:hypothetical protein
MNRHIPLTAYTYLFAPTFKSDPKYKLFEKLDTELHVFHEYTDELMEGAIADIKSGIDAHTAYLEQLKVYKKWMRDKDELRDFQSKALRTLEALDYKKPVSPYPRGPPVSIMIFDDCTGSSLYRPTVTGAANTFFIALICFRIADIPWRCASSASCESILPHIIPKQK